MSMFVTANFKFGEFMVHEQIGCSWVFTHPQVGVSTKFSVQQEIKCRNKCLFPGEFRYLPVT